MAKDKFKIISIRRLADVCEIQYLRLYQNLTDRYSGKNGRALSDNEKLDIANHLYVELKDIADFLGIEFKMKKKTKVK